ncbi:MAG: LysR family transcriptional regulator [Rhodospirillales bacterium]|nr:LysR family transcriptional regulator [Rhodospirillales bacterium]
MTILPTLRQLSYLVALADHNHFGRAAEACHVTQSTLSAGIQELETLLAASLVERTKRRVMFTPLGEQIVARARGLLRGAEDIAELARAAGEPLAGTLRLGVIPTIGPYLLPDLLPALRQRFPRLKLYLREDLTGRVLDQLSAGHLDAVLIALPYPAEDLETVVVGDDPFVVACLPDDPLCRGETVRVADMAGAPLLLLEEGHCLREHALAACRLARGGTAEGVQGTSLHTLVQMVANGLGVTLLPRMAVAADVLRGTGLVTRPLQGEDAARRIGLGWRKSSPRKREFLMLAEVIRERMAAKTLTPTLSRKRERM